jgi:energy-coupling factor transport system substrate-specific component
MERQYQRLALPVVIVLFVIGIAFMSAVANQQYWLISFVFVFLAVGPFFLRFERKSSHVREIMIMVILIAIAAISRVPFAAIPSVLPMTFIIIASALVFGAETGFMIGALSAVVSNLFLGQGPWTPWQMFCWGMIGCLAGLLKDTWWMRTLWGKLVFSFIAGILFGWLMNLTRVVTTLADFSWQSLLFTYTASFIFDLLHALSNVFFMLVFGAAWVRILKRIQKKYGLLLENSEPSGGN